MKNRGSTSILTNLVGVHPRNIHTKFEANPCSGLRGEVEKLKSSRRQQRQRRQRQRQRRRRRRTQPDRYSHTHSLSVTKKTCNSLMGEIISKIITEGLDQNSGKIIVMDNMEIDRNFYK